MADCWHSRTADPEIKRVKERKETRRVLEPLGSPATAPTSSHRTGCEAGVGQGKEARGGNLL